MTEAEWQKRITDFCDLLHLKWCHFRPARTEKGWRTAIEGHKGFPDLVILGPSSAIFAELKSETGKMSHDQWGWVDGLSAAGCRSYVWRPSDWPVVQHLLTDLARR